jgi:hypothetical protein
VSYLAQTLLVSSVILHPAECANGAANADSQPLYEWRGLSSVQSFAITSSQSEISVSFACATKLASHDTRRRGHRCGSAVLEWLWSSPFDIAGTRWNITYELLVSGEAIAACAKKTVGNARYT